MASPYSSFFQGIIRAIDLCVCSLTIQIVGQVL